MDSLSDVEIVEQFQAGNHEEAFRNLVEIHGKTVYNIALFTLNDEILAEDATQDAFIKIYRNLGKFKGQSKLSTWMYRIVKNVCYDYLKKRRYAPLDEIEEGYPMSDDGSPEDEVMSDWQSRELRDAVEQLPIKQRLAITLYYFKDKSYEEVASILGQPLNTIKSHLHRAKSALEKSLTRLEGSFV
ncbi:MAG: sigma-70 family RNA polymerase sigma factor [Fidelibacterota bacterium]|nr:MAG: sigma-70 family RNA polymerase sigma factor [Candidatus Neomarinimicrobiota bacterium]